MDTQFPKPRLVFFQNKYDASLPEFLLEHTREHVRCLSVSFDVVVIHDDSNYEQVCEIHQPDLALFESGVNLLTCRKPKISNVKSCRAIPKLALLNADAWCETRSGSISEIEEWDVDAVFSIAAAAREHLPEIADRLYIWPNSIDPTTYHDYEQEKVLPVLLSGATAAQYPWRRRVFKLIAEHYPTLTCPHQGYLSRAEKEQALYGERYARMLSLAKFSPACGTVGGEIVRKHFEIPGCHTCLITEETSRIKQAGFVDMENCVFADSHDVLDKLALLFGDDERLGAITSAGYRLVQSQHTLNQRPQILEWLVLKGGLKPGERIEQSNPFHSLKLVPATSQPNFVAEIGSSAHLKALHEGDTLLFAGDIDAAESKYIRCLSYMRRLPEARLKLALCKLHRGEAAAANASLFELIQYCLDEYGAAVPDPVEWAYFIISLLGQGRVSEANSYAQEFPSLHHEELDRVRTVILAARGEGSAAAASEAGSKIRRASIHRCAHNSAIEWREELYKILRACGQESLVGKIVDTLQAATSRGSAFDDQSTTPRHLKSDSVTGSRDSILKRRLMRFRIERKLRRLQIRLKKWMRLNGEPVETAEMIPAVNTPWLRAVREVARDFDMKTVLLVGDSMRDGMRRAIRDGALGDSGVHFICEIGSSYDFNDAASWMMNAEETLDKFNDAHHSNGFDLIVSTGYRDTDESLLKSLFGQELGRAKRIVLVDPEIPWHHAICTEIISDSRYVVTDRDGFQGTYLTLMKRVDAAEATAVDVAREKRPNYIQH